MRSDPRRITERREIPASRNISRPTCIRERLAPRGSRIMTASVTHEASCSVPNAGSSEVRTKTASASSGGGFCAICAGSSGATMILTGVPSAAGSSNVSIA